MKELDESQKLPVKFYLKEALHRNEVTGEVEPSGF